MSIWSRVLYKVARKSGWRLESTLAACLDTLAKSGLRFDVVWDVGAHDGSWSEDMSKLPVLRHAEFFLCEANPTHELALISRGFPHHIGVLGAENREVEFFSVGGTGDSVFREMTGIYDNVMPSIMHMKTLDDLIDATNWPYPDFVKLDVQGSERDVLLGGRKALDSASSILCELSIGEYNEGAPGISDVLGVLRDMSFQPYAIVDTHRHRERLVQMDILFVRNGILCD